MVLPIACSVGSGTSPVSVAVVVVMAAAAAVVGVVEESGAVVTGALNC